MDILPINYMPGDPMLIENIVCELKSQGIFDSFRKECISDVDTKPAYQNLRQRVDSSVSSFLRKQAWSADLNKNQLREKLRKNICESGFLETGVERIVDQVVNPKINSIFLPKVIDVVYTYLGLEKPDPKTDEDGDDSKIKSEELLPKELEAVSPESRPEEKTYESDCSQEDVKMEEDESPPFEPLGDEHSMDSHLSGISGLQSHDSNMSVKALQIDESQTSKNSSEESTDNGIEKQMQRIEIDKKGDAGKMSVDECSSSQDTCNTNLSKCEEPDDLDQPREVRKKDSRSMRPEKDRQERRHESSSRSKDKYSRGRERDRQRDRDRSRDKDRERSKSSRHSSSARKDDRRDKERRDRRSTSSKCSKYDSYKEKRSTSSRGRDREKKESKDDHYSYKNNKSTRRSTDRDSNDGSGMKSASSGDSNNSQSNSQTNKDPPKEADTNSSGGNETKQMSTTMSVSAESWNALEAQLISNVSNNSQETETIVGELDGQDTNKENMKKSMKRKNSVAKTDVIVKKSKTNHLASKAPSLHFNLPLSPAESDCDKQSHVTKASRQNVNARQRYSSEDLYKPRPTFKRTTRRLAGNNMD